MQLVENDEVAPVHHRAAGTGLVPATFPSPKAACSLTAAHPLGEKTAQFHPPTIFIYSSRGRDQRKELEVFSVFYSL